MKKSLKYVLKVMLFMAFLFVSFSLLYQHKNPGVNFQTKVTIQECIYRGIHQSITIDEFQINYITNAPIDCINPNFPVIHIVGASQYDGWIHVVHTDSPEYPAGYFIDTCKDIYPFYTLEKDFYDAPHWNSTLLHKPLTYWHGHAYAVKINRDAKTVTYVAGIKWGFEFSLFRLNPKAIAPCQLTFADWEQDEKIIHCFYDMLG